MKSRYGITEQQLVELAAHQGNVCAICGDPPDPTQKRKGLHVDHDHRTSAVRGLLCEPCNLGLGFFRDKLDRLLAAAAYLKEPPATKVVYTDPLPRPLTADGQGQRNPAKTETIQLVCKHCGKAFPRRAQSEHLNRKRDREGPFCGQKCVSDWTWEQRGVKGLVHGTTTGYTSFRCRCHECKKAHTEAERDRLRRRRRGVHEDRRS